MKGLRTGQLVDLETRSGAFVARAKIVSIAPLIAKMRNNDKEVKCHKYGRSIDKVGGVYVYIRVRPIENI